MTVIKHTPGPWRTSLTDDTVVVDAAGREVAAIDGDYNDPDTWPLMEANARLIAAAPDLLAALAEMIDCYGSDDGCGPIPIIDRANAAIAKAGG